MCRHNWREINDIRVCLRCGLTVIKNGSVLFDRNIMNYRPRKKGRKKNGKET